jgi:hypothetical protein
MFMAKTKKKKAGKNEENLKISGTLKKVIAASIGKLPEKQPVKPAEEDTIPGNQEGLKKQDRPIK